jgi:hypothetical protein
MQQIKVSAENTDLTAFARILKAASLLKANTCPVNFLYST